MKKENNPLPEKPELTFYKFRFNELVLDSDGERYLKIQIGVKLLEIFGKYEATRRISAKRFDEEVAAIERNFENESEKIRVSHEMEASAVDQGGLIGAEEIRQNAKNLIAQLTLEKEDAIHNVQNQKKMYMLDHPDVIHKADLQEMKYKANKSEIETYIKLRVPQSLVDDIKVMVNKSILHNYHIALIKVSTDPF